MTPFPHAIAALIVALTFLPTPAVAQAPINAPAAMQPSTGTGVWHIMPYYRELGSDPTSTTEGGREYIVLSQLAYGITSEFSLQFDAPLVWSDLDLAGGMESDDFGVADMTLLAKYRIYQHDSGPTDTARFSIIGGLQIPGSTEMRMDSSGDAWDPIIGGVFSTVRGRNGLNASLLWEFYTGSDGNMSDSLRYDASYLYRVSPAQYTVETTGAWYAVMELNGYYGTNGDHELFLSPGVMYEARSYTIDATVMIPVHQEVDHRAESEFLIGIGVRLSF